MRLVFTLLFSVILSSFPGWVEADYIPPKTEMAFESADLVFEGKVLSNNPKENPSNQGHPDWLTVATLHANKVWKGSVKEGDEIEIHLIVDPCGTTISAEPEEVYVIFARLKEDADIFLKVPKDALCSGLHYGTFRLRPNPKAKIRRIDADVVKKLDRLSAQHGGPADAGTTGPRR